MCSHGPGYIGWGFSGWHHTVFVHIAGQTASVVWRGNTHAGLYRGMLLGLNFKLGTPSGMLCRQSPTPSMHASSAHDASVGPCRLTPVCQEERKGRLQDVCLGGPRQE